LPHQDRLDVLLLPWRDAETDVGQKLDRVVQMENQNRLGVLVDKRQCDEAMSFLVYFPRPGSNSAPSISRPRLMKPLRAAEL
jgi:hypothetical protein